MSQQRNSLPRASVILTMAVLLVFLPRALALSPSLPLTTQANSVWDSLNTYAALFQAGATILLCALTGCYVFHTSRLAKVPLELHDKVASQRRQFAFTAIRMELKQIEDATHPVNNEARPIRLPTANWDAMNPDLVDLDQWTMETLAKLYLSVRQANALYDHWIYAQTPGLKGPYQNKWGESSGELRELACNAGKAMEGTY